MQGTEKYPIIRFGKQNKLTGSSPCNLAAGGEGILIGYAQVSKADGSQRLDPCFHGLGCCSTTLSMVRLVPRGVGANRAMNKVEVLVCLLVCTMASFGVAYGSEDQHEWAEDAKTPRAASLRAAFADWCDERSGILVLRVGQPFCIVFDNGSEALFVGEWRLVREQYWWSVCHNSLRVGVLWLVDPPTPEEVAQSGYVGSSESLMMSECVIGFQAMQNPANVPIILIGPAAEECEEMIQDHLSGT